MVVHGIRLRLITLVRCLIEEVRDLEAIDDENYPLLEEELGDLLLQVVFGIASKENLNLIWRMWQEDQ